MTLSNDAGSHRGLPALPPESPIDVTEVSPHSFLTPRSPTAGHIAMLSSASSMSAMAPPAGSGSSHSPNTPSRAEGLDFKEAAAGNTAGMQMEEEPVVPHHAAIESNVSMTLEQNLDGRDSHLMFQKTLKNIFDDGRGRGLPMPEPQGLPKRTAGGDDDSDDEEEPMPFPVQTAGGHYAEPSDQPMNAQLEVASGHIAAASSASSFGFHSKYDSMYGRGVGHTAGYQGHRQSNASTGSWKE